MKRPIYLLLLLCVYAMTYAQYSKKVELNFDPKEYEIEYNSFDEGMIVSHNASTFFESDTNLPCIPYMMVSVAVPIDREYESHTVSAEGRTLFADGIVLANNPIIVPTSYTGTIKEEPASYKKCTYPETTASNEISSTVGKYRILNFKVSPFEYDAERGILKFSKKISLNIKLKKSYANVCSWLREPSYALLRNIVVNKDDVEDSDNDGMCYLHYPEFPPKVKYLIVTNEDLKEYYEPLVEWKTKKGVKAEVITTKYIDDNYEGNSLQLKIKNCLYQYYQTDTLQYVLLGGDTNIIPAFKCHILYSRWPIATNKMPTDLFYACFDGAFDWDGNGNGKCGELEDSINLYPYIAVTRFPARTQADVEAFVSKTLYYEKTPSQDGWNNKILMSGNKLFGILDTVPNIVSDAQAKGQTFYLSFVRNGWTGTRTRFYDTATDIPPGARYDFTREHLNEQITKGYAFIDVLTHGIPIGWCMEDTLHKYLKSNAQSSQSLHPSIITTAACFTNAFDSISTCLSEAFIKNPNNAVVGYLGCSRESWLIRGTRALGPSMQYTDEFYKGIVSNDGLKNFGWVVANAKYAKASLCNTNDKTYRWLQFGLNPLGDPEMPVYSVTPQKFDNLQLTVDSDHIITLYPGVPGCRICLMSSDDGGTRFYDVRENVQTPQQFNMVGNISICVTKPNYEPFIIETFAQSQEIFAEIESITPNPTTGPLTATVRLFGRNVFDGKLVIRSMSGVVEKNIVLPLGYPVPNSQTNTTLTVSDDISSLPNGIHILSLEINGNIMREAKCIIKN